MSDDLDEQDSYHYDFTTASEWEIFIARLEELIHEWKLPQQKCGPPLLKAQFCKGEWEKKSEKIMFADSEFTFSSYSLKTTESKDDVSPNEDELEDGKSQTLCDIMSRENDFLPPISDVSWDGGNSHLVLVRWYGLRDYLILTPARGQAVSSESKVKILLSSALIAINNSSCPVPIFVQVHAPNQMYYMGVGEGKSVRTDFEMVHLLRTPPHCKYLTGLLNMFKSKVASPAPLEPVSVAVRFTYILRDWTRNSWCQEPLDYDFLEGEAGVENLGKLPFGVAFEPISELRLYATWPHLMENAVVDSESYSDLEPTQAPHWSAGVAAAERPACLMADHLAEFVQLCASERTMHELLGDLVDKNAGPDLSSSLSLLTESRVPTISRVIKRAKGGGGGRQQQRKGDKGREGPLADELLMPILYFLFPDAEEKPKHPYPDLLGGGDEAGKQKDLQVPSFSGLKSVPQGSLIWRLAVVLSHVVHTLGGLKAAAHLWFEFVQEMRFRWERNILIPGVMPGFPDHRTCLLHQKLQMLNCCVARKTAREQTARAASVDTVDSNSSDSEEEFYDCSDEEAPPPAARQQHKHSLWNQPVGRLRRHGNLRLVSTGEHLYIPLTQDPTPKTEDQIEEDAEVLLQLGTDAQGAELRARMMSASMLSDMESFKAANPGAILDDFIRWYSPRDWVEVEGTDQYGQKNGTLSNRMMIPGNTWLEVWEAAKPVPARRQKRLFDDTREAEKVLHFLDSRRPAQAAQLLLPALTHAAICRLAEERRDELPSMKDRLGQLVKTAERLTRSAQPNLKRYEDLTADISGVEAMIAQYASLQHKFADPNGTTNSTDLTSFLVALTTLPEVEVTGGPRGHTRSRIYAMFGEAQKVAKMITESEPLEPNEDSWSLSPSNFPRPNSREFLLRVMAARPAPHSAHTPQRLYATLKKEDFRLVGSFSHETTFL